jgi:plasmid segregation protein ParM
LQLIFPNFLNISFQTPTKGLIQLNISYWVADFGNSFGQQMIDGHYFEMPSSIKEISKSDVDGMFAHNISAESIEDHLVIKVTMDEDRYFMAGKRAQAELLGNAHIHTLHDKTQSMTVWITWLAGLALYHATKQPDLIEDRVEVDYFGTLLPVWLVKKASSFKEKLASMAARFQTELSFELLTPGVSRKLDLAVKFAECRIEGENARHALKYDLNGNTKDDFHRFAKAYVVMDDIGGQSQDMCKLQPGLTGAQSADDFRSSTDQSYLAVLEKLRTDKLMDYFSSVRALELFILAHVKTRKYEFTHPVSHKKCDLTPVIEPVLRTFAEVAMQMPLQSYTFRQGDEVIYVHMGGVNELLQYYMKEYLAQLLGVDVAETYHIFPNESRKLNIYASSIVAKSYLLRQAEKAAQAAEGK